MPLRATPLALSMPHDIGASVEPKMDAVSEYCVQKWQFACAASSSRRSGETEGAEQNKVASLQPLTMP
jgi:hypothetical protein